MIVRRDGTPVPASETAAGPAAWLYGPGRRLVPLVASHLVARAYGVWARSPISRRAIEPFCRRHRIGCANPGQWASFAAFFERDFPARPVIGDGLVSPADAKLTCVPIDDDCRLQVKGASYTVDELLGHPTEADFDEIHSWLEGMIGGHALVFRLTMDDHHRYLYPSNGYLYHASRVSGRLHTVGPASWGVNVLAENERQWQLFDSPNVGGIIICQVGAMLVGSIHNQHPDDPDELVAKGTPHGHFSLGGSTIVLLVGPAVTLDEDILEQNALGHEVRVRCGEGIGR